jgi:diguanylate cyclase (GGDEF)-like protein
MSPSATKVLIVDDDPENRNEIAKWLEPLAYQAECVADGDLAADSIQQRCPNILIVDAAIPGLGGVALCRRIRQDTLPHYVYTILLAPPSLADAVEEGLAAGADDVLIKPVDKHRLLARLQVANRILDRERQLVRQATTDTLTGIPNRFCLYEHFERELWRARRYSLPLSCLLVDIDHFKQVNDIHGHAVGDQVLRAIAALLNSTCRCSDYVCRYGGEEFCILLTETGLEDAVIYAERARTCISGLHIPTEKGTLRVTASIGVATRSPESCHPDDLVDLADQALLEAKRSGRNRVQRARPVRSSVSTSLLTPSGNPFAGRRARDIMSSPITTLHQDAGLDRAADFLLRMRINSVPIVDDEGLLVGIISEKDLIRLKLTSEVWSEPIRSHMTTNVVAYDEETPADVIHDFLRRLTVRRVVVTRDGRPTGVISRGSILRFLGNWGEIRRPLDHQWQAENREFQLKRSRRSISMIITALGRHLEEMKAAVGDSNDAYLAAVIDRATRMQDAIIELLANTQIHYQFAPPELARWGDG